MSMRTDRMIYNTIALLFLLVVSAGCAETNIGVKDTSQAVMNDTGVIQSVQVSNDASQIIIAADKPITFTFYKSAEPPMAVIDLAQTEPGKIARQIAVNSGNIKDIHITSHSVGGGVLSRIEIALVKDAEFKVTPDPADKAKLLLAFSKASSTGSTVALEEKQKTAAERKEAEKIAEEPAQQAESEESTSVPDTGVEGKGISKPDLTESDADVSPGGGQAKPAATPPPAEEKKVVAAGVETKAAIKPGQRVLTAVNVVNDGVELVVSGGVESVTSFKLTKPTRLIVDIVGGKNGIAAKFIPVNKFGIAKARLGATKDKVRVVFDAEKDSLPVYQVNKFEKGVKVVFSGVPVTASDKGQAAAASTKPAPAAETRKPAKSKTGIVEAIDFKLTDGYSRIAIRVSGDCNPGKPVKAAEGLALTIKNCQIPANLQRMLDTRAFASVVTGITPYQIRMKKGYDSRFLVRLRVDAPYRINQEGDTIFWDIKNPEGLEAPPLMAEVVKQPVRPIAVKPGKTEVIDGTASKVAHQKPYTGRRVSLEFSDADIRKIFQLIAEVSNLNFLIADDVTGTISLKLINVPWDQALDVILESKNLEKKQDGNIMYIRQKGKFRTQEQEDAEAQKAREKAMPLITQVFDVNFAAIGDVGGQFKSLASDRGKDNIILDTRTNKVIVTDIEPKLLAMKDLLKILDVPEKQVMIEARIVEATSTFTRDIGVQWGIHYKNPAGNFLGINQLDTGFGGIVTPPPSSGFQASDSAGGSMGLSFGTLNSNVQVDLRLSAAATAGLIKIISTPKVVTLNNKAARITQGQSIPYQTTSAEGTKTEFVQAALTLEVTPHITADGSIGMKVHATNNSAGTGSPPQINTKEATTELQVKNGETTVIGGIYVDSDTESDQGVPFLMDIPLLGWLFKSNTKTKTKTELLIFITPKIVI